jgi:hypothetical protein
VTGVRILQSGGDPVFGPFRPRDGVICALASAGEWANAVYHPRGGQDLGPPTRLAVLLVGRRVGRWRDRPELTVVLVVGTGGEEQRVGARFGTAAQSQGPQPIDRQRSSVEAG